jgi:hypothetical protein
MSISARVIPSTWGKNRETRKREKESLAKDSLSLCSVEENRIVLLLAPVKPFVVRYGDL